MAKPVLVPPDATTLDPQRRDIAIIAAQKIRDLFGALVWIQPRMEDSLDLDFIAAMTVVESLTTRGNNLADSLLSALDYGGLSESSMGEITAEVNNG